MESKPATTPLNLSCGDAVGTNQLDQEDLLLILNFATRLMVLNPDMDVVIERILETVADFAGNRTAALFLLDEKRSVLNLQGLFKEGRYRRVSREFHALDTFVGRILAEKEPCCHPADNSLDFPFPATGGTPGGRDCICIPLAGGRTNMLGLMTLDQPHGAPWGSCDLQMVIVLATMGAISIENLNLFKMATTDYLTGLFLRTFFELRFREEIARLKRYGGSAALFVIDIDNFKTINDTCGHQCGDEVLVHLARLLQINTRRDVDIPCRYGGDEIIVLLPNTQQENAVNIIRRIQAECGSRAFTGKGATIRATISVGLVMLDPAEELPPEEMIRRADHMLYKAKDEGKNRLCVWDAGQ